MNQGTNVRVMCVIHVKRDGKELRIQTFSATEAYYMTQLLSATKTDHVLELVLDEIATEESKQLTKT